MGPRAQPKEPGHEMATARVSIHVYKTQCVWIPSSWFRSAECCQGPSPSHSNFHKTLTGQVAVPVSILLLRKLRLERSGDPDAQQNRHRPRDESSPQPPCSLLLLHQSGPFCPLAPPSRAVSPHPPPCSQPPGAGQGKAGCWALSLWAPHSGTARAPALLNLQDMK